MSMPPRLGGPAACVAAGCGAWVTEIPVGAAAGAVGAGAGIVASGARRAHAARLKAATEPNNPVTNCLRESVRMYRFLSNLVSWPVGLGGAKLSTYGGALHGCSASLSREG